MNFNLLRMSCIFSLESMDIQKFSSKGHSSLATFPSSELYESGTKHDHQTADSKETPLIRLKRIKRQVKETIQTHPKQLKCAQSMTRMELSLFMQLYQALTVAASMAILLDLPSTLR